MSSLERKSILLGAFIQSESEADRIGEFLPAGDQQVFAELLQFALASNFAKFLNLIFRISPFPFSVTASSRVARHT